MNNTSSIAARLSNVMGHPNFPKFLGSISYGFLISDPRNGYAFQGTEALDKILSDVEKQLEDPVCEQ